jgi:predicted HD phosphohydrolase
VTDAFTSVQDLFGALEASRFSDDEGGLSILDHSLQCAELLESLRPDDVELQVAGLVHDLGWLERSATDGWMLSADAAHDADGRRRIEDLLGPRVAGLVGGHVQAKRYLLATESEYRDRLSARSVTTLGFQGGVMRPDEADEFAKSEGCADLVTLRRADDAAKVRGKPVPGLDEWRDAVERVAASHSR